MRDTRWNFRGVMSFNKIKQGDQTWLLLYTSSRRFAVAVRLPAFVGGRGASLRTFVSRGRLMFGGGRRCSCGL